VAAGEKEALRLLAVPVSRREAGWVRKDKGLEIGRREMAAGGQRYGGESADYDQFNGLAIPFSDEEN